MVVLRSGYVKVSGVYTKMRKVLNAVAMSKRRDYIERLNKFASELNKYMFDLFNERGYSKDDVVYIEMEFDPLEIRADKMKVRVYKQVDEFEVEPNIEEVGEE